MDEVTSRSYIYIISFWVLLTLLSNIFVDYLDAQSLTDAETNCLYENCNPIEFNIEKGTNVLTQLFDSIFNLLDLIPGVNLITPLFRIMTFQYAHIINPLATILLDMLFIISAWIIVNVARG